jgi:FG-GAP repeat
VCSAGNVNGDGYGDVLVGASQYDDGQEDEGVVFLYLGSPGGLSSAPARLWQGDQAGARFGSSVSGAGNVDADGFDDVLIGDPGFDGGEMDEGAAFLFLGAASELPAAPAWSAEGNQAGASFGSSVVALGDMNHDGFGDVVIGAPFYDGGHVDQGQARVFGGTSSGLGASPLHSFMTTDEGEHFGSSVAGAGDLTGEGIRRILLGAPLYAYSHQEEGGPFFDIGQSVFFLDFGGQDFAHRGVSIASAGDVNANGLGDVVIGADRFDAGEEDEGRGTVHLGHPSFVVDRTPVWVVDGDQSFCAFGSSVASA